METETSTQKSLSKTTKPRAKGQPGRKRATAESKSTPTFPGATISKAIKFVLKDLPASETKGKSELRSSSEAKEAIKLALETFIKSNAEYAWTLVINVQNLATMKQNVVKMAVTQCKTLDPKLAAAAEMTANSVKKQRKKTKPEEGSASTTAAAGGKAKRRTREKGHKEIYLQEITLKKIIMSMADQVSELEAQKGSKRRKTTTGAEKEKSKPGSRISRGALVLFKQYAIKYLEQLVRSSAEWAQHAKRVTLHEDDVHKALERM